jgi:hypothetical protein
MALFDNNPISALTNPVTSGIGSLFEGMTPFGSTIPGGILKEEDEAKLRNQALIQGLLGTAATYLATPKNLNAGSPLPYIGKAVLGGMGASQDVIDRAIRAKLLSGRDDNLYNVDGALVDKSGKVIYQSPTKQQERKTAVVDGVLVDANTGEKIYESTKQQKLNTDIIDVGTKKILINKDTGAPIQEFMVTKPPKEEDTFKQTNELRTSFLNLPEVKAWNITQPILMSAREAAKDTSGASDLNLIYALGKALDPNSVVREGELELAAGTGSLGEKLKGYYKSTAVGGKLTPEIKRDLLRQIESRTYAQKKQYDSAKKQYTSIANKYKLDPSELFIEPIVEPLDTSQPVKRLSTQDQQALDWANANSKDPRAAQIKQRLGL